MQEYVVQRSSRKCFLSDQAFRPGERYISAILQKGSDLVRRDFSEERWPGPSEDTIGWWKCRLPIKKSSGRRLAPSVVLLDTLNALLETPGKESLAYLLAILLIRRRILLERDPVGVMDGEWANLSLHTSNDSRKYVVPVLQLDERVKGELHQQLLELLYTED